ncbi:MAG: hypothetical protein QXS54_07795, partial [Candidatus Methanomethylicaceae archaeon]
ARLSHPGGVEFFIERIFNSYEEHFIHKIRYRSIHLHLLRQTSIIATGLLLSLCAQWQLSIVVDPH